jgi:hypothetical protein
MVNLDAKYNLEGDNGNIMGGLKAHVQCPNPRDLEMWQY